MRQAVRTHQLVIALFLALILSGCLSASGPRRVEPSGVYKHVITELEYPERIGVFRRQYVTEYDADGYDAAGHYGTPTTLGITATVYHYPATATAVAPTDEEFSNHFKQVHQEVLRSAEGGTMLSVEAETHEVNSFSLQGMHSVYAFDSLRGYNAEVRSHLYLFVLDGWYLKFRFTYPSEIDEGGRGHAAEMIRLMKWPIPPPAA